MRLVHFHGHDARCITRARTRPRSAMRTIAQALAFTRRVNHLRLQIKDRRGGFWSTVSRVRCMSNGPGGGFYAAWAVAVFRRLSEDGGPVRRFCGGLPAALHEPERAQEARCVGHGDVGDACRAQALRAYRGVRGDEVLPELLGMSR